ncbi:zinc finger protein hypothetical protein [Limosa lapponica baueri]|uniref:Uncharacterized protein n=1 Tax=Limosa lapponica baueri TaxID=1758121 RepID=A0A2I0TFP4_LIMLA|nr:zinc finger protein hypothetical protein [Limosa lapponica baueri]
MRQKSNLGTLKDSQEFTEEKPQSPQDYHNVVKLLEKQESKWTSRIQALHHDHETEKSLLLSQIEKLKSSVREDLNKNNTFYKRRIEELGQRLQEQNDLIITQKKQIKELSTRSVANIKPYDVNTTLEHLEEPKPTLPVMHDKQKFSQSGISSFATPRKPVKRSSTAVRPAEQRTAVAENTSTPKSMKLFGNGVPRKTSSITTPPFSSEEEGDEDDIKQHYISPELLQKQSKTSSSKVSAFQKASGKSDMDGTEESETEETGTPAKTSKGFFTTFVYACCNSCT